MIPGIAHAEKFEYEGFFGLMWQSVSVDDGSLGRGSSQMTARFMTDEGRTYFMQAEACRERLAQLAADLEYAQRQLREIAEKKERRRQKRLARLALNKSMTEGERMAAAVDRGPEAIQRTMQELRLESMPDRVRFANPIERRWFSNRQEGWREYVVLETLDGFEKKEWVDPRVENHIFPCRPVFKMAPLDLFDPGEVSVIVEKRILFERTTDKTIDGMTIFREVPT